MNIFNTEIKYAHGMTYREVPFSVSSHTHPYFELVYYIEGTGKSVIDRQTHAYKPGTFVYIPPNIKHSEVAETISTHFLIGFTFNQDIQTIPAGLYTDDDGQFYRLLMEIREEFSQSKSYYKVRMDDIAEEILIGMIRKYAPQADSPDSRMEMAVNYLSTYYNKQVDFNELAASVYYSYDRFRHLFVRYTGQTPQRYLNNLRLGMAKSYLLSTTASVADIAEDVGYSSASNFVIDFKKQYGITPLKYRKHPPGFDQEVTFTKQ